MAAIQLATGCLDVTCTEILRSRPLGMLVSSAAALEAFGSAETTRRAVSPFIGDGAVPEGVMDSRAAAAGYAPPKSADTGTAEAAPGATTYSRARTRDASPGPGPADTPNAAPGTKAGT